MKTSVNIIMLLMMFVPVQFLSAEQRYDIPLGNAPSLGPGNAPVTIIEFLDFQ